MIEDLRVVLVDDHPMFRQGLRTLLEDLGVTVLQGYGSTETGGLSTYASNAILSASPECVGPALPTVAVRTVDANGNDVPEGRTETSSCAARC